MTSEFELQTSYVFIEFTTVNRAGVIYEVAAALAFRGVYIEHLLALSGQESARSLQDANTQAATRSEPKLPVDYGRFFLVAKLQRIREEETQTDWEAEATNLRYFLASLDVVRNNPPVDAYVADNKRTNVIQNLQGAIKSCFPNPKDQPTQ